VIKLCPRCRRPFLGVKGSCPKCPDVGNINADSMANLGCMVATILPLAAMILFWLLLFLGFFFR
jgi:hypothetical protein